MIDFPSSSFMHDTITTNNVFRNVHRLIKVKVHLHHSHITGKILGYAHDFCNWNVRENKSEIALTAHNLFGFNMFFFIKGYPGTAWGTKDLNVGKTNLTHINDGNIAGEIKFIGTLKYYQKRLGELAATLSEDEKNSVKQLTKQFFNRQPYFSEVWKYLGDSQKNKVLEIIAEGKGIIPYEKIVDMNSMFLTPENDVFFEKSEFYSDLKQQAVSDSDYESSVFLYRTLKMQNLGDKNDLYNVQDVILLCEIAENRFHFMHDQYSLNPNKCNSVSTRSGCIETEMSRVLIALPTSNEAIDIFEQTITGGFSSVNTRLAFDTEIVLPNLINEEKQREEFQKDYNYKIWSNIRKRIFKKKGHNKNFKERQKQPVRFRYDKTITDWLYKTRF